ncbi:MAG: PTS fructose transporter subunit IIA [Gammaproteobacteria bacterium]
MSVGILIISHNGIGASVYGTANFMIKDSPLEIKLLSASRESDPDELLETAISLLKELDSGDGILVLTDLIGSTPSNIARKLFEHARVNIVTGLNLSMMIRVLNYPELDLHQLADKAYSGAIDGVSIDRG